MSQYDAVELIHSENLSAKSFHFDPWFIKACLTFDNLDEDIEIDEQHVYNRHMLYMFTKHKDNFQGIFNLTPQNYIHINELLLMIGAETFSQSDGFWTCRIRRMLLQVINCIYDIYVDQRKLGFFKETEITNPATICAEYIHTNYNQNITLKELLSNTNMRIDEIAENCGFKYDTYFIRQFTEKMGISPASYRKNPLGYTAFDGRPIQKLTQSLPQ